MSRPGPDDRLMLSALDRLLDNNPDVSTEPIDAPGLDDVLESVRRDLVGLLNTRLSRPDLVDVQSEVATSLMTYGVLDFASISKMHGDQLETARRSVERAIVVFEPRLRNVAVKIARPPEKGSRSLHLSIHALLHVDPISEPVEFDAEIESNTGNCRIEHQARPLT